jgi:hypothetical protein
VDGHGSTTGQRSSRRGQPATTPGNWSANCWNAINRQSNLLSVFTCELINLFVVTRKANLQDEQRSRIEEVEKGKLIFRRKRSLQTAPTARAPKRSTSVETMRRLQRFIEMHRFVERYVRSVNDQNAQFVNKIMFKKH